MQGYEKMAFLTIISLYLENDTRQIYNYYYYCLLRFPCLLCCMCFYCYHFFGEIKMYIFIANRKPYPFSLTLSDVE